MNNDAILRAYKIFYEYFRMESPSEEIGRKIHEWMLRDENAEEKEVALFMIFEHIMDGEIKLRPAAKKKTEI